MTIEQTPQNHINSSHQESVGIQEIFRILNRGKIIIALTVIACVALSWIYTARLPRQYTATARIDIDLKGRSGLKVDTDVGDTNTATKLDTQIGILRSQSLAWDVIKRLKLYTDPKFMGGTPYAEGTDPEQFPATARLLLISRFLRGLSVQYERGTEIADIRYESTDPVLSADIANEIAESYENRNFQTRYETTQKASNWLKGQLEGLRKTVTQSQKDFADFQKQKGFLKTDESRNPGSEKLTQLNTALASAEVQRILKENIYRASQSAEPDQVAPAGSFPSLTSLRLQKATLEGNYASLSAKYGDAYPRVMQLQKEIDQVRLAIERESTRARHQIELEYVQAQNNEKGLVGAVEQQKQEIFAINENGLQYTILERQVTSSRDLYEDLIKKLQEAGITSGLTADSIAVIDKALPPYVPSGPRRTLNLEIGFLIGLLLGIGLAIIFEVLNSSIRTVEDIRLYSGLPALGLIPHGENDSAQGGIRSIASAVQSRMKITSDPKSRFAEGYRNLRSSLLLSSAGSPPRLIVISSAWPKEGKSTTAINLATVLSQSGKRVLLVDADLKRPSLQTSYDRSLLGPIGLSEMLSGLEPPASNSRPDPAVPTLEVIFSGAIPPSSSELLMSTRMGSLLEQWRSEYDFIVVDTAPLLAVSDASFLISVADAVVIVVRSGKTRRKALRALRDAIFGVRGKIAGVLLNDVKSSSDAYYDYYGGTKKDYAAYYTSDKSE